MNVLQRVPHPESDFSDHRRLAAGHCRLGHHAPRRHCPMIRRTPSGQQPGKPAHKGGGPLSDQRFGNFGHWQAEFIGLRNPENAKQYVQS